MPGLDALETKAGVDELLNRWPTVGLAVGVVRGGSLEFLGHGLADIASRTPVTEETVYRIGSVTKTMTAAIINATILPGATFELARAAVSQS